MSTIPPPETTPPPDAALRVGGVVETAPSAQVVEGPTFARLVGFSGLFLLVLGAVVVISTRALGPRWVPESLGYVFAVLGLALMLYLAFVDGDVEVRRAFGGFALFWLGVAVVASLLPGAPTPTAAKAVGYHLLPWGVGAAVVALLFLLPFCRHETDELYRSIGVNLLLAVGGVLTVGGVTAGAVRSELLTGPGLTLTLLGVAFLCAYLGQVDTSDGIGYTVAFSVGAFGAVVALYALGRATLPHILYEGPAALREPNGDRNWKETVWRVLGGVGFLVPFLFAVGYRSPGWLRAVTGAVGLAGAGVVAVSLFTNPVRSAPAPFFVPDGLILTAVGVLLLAVSVGVCSDNQFVTLTRRELSAYFQSPIGYLVLGGMVLIEWNQYRLFVNEMGRFGEADVPFPEPIVRRLFVNLLPVLAIMLQVPLLTMRLVAEERRTGSLEVLLTSPVGEWPVAASKFVATWLFFLLSWLPLGLFLIALRLEVPVAFDYRPLLSFYLCLAAQGLAFVGMGLFFSTLTKNQIIAAVLAMVGMVFFILCYLVQGEGTAGLPAYLQTAATRLSFVNMWFEAVAGRLPLRDCLLFASLGALGLFLSVKVLEARKWN